MLLRILKIVMIITAIFVGLYPFIYFFVDRKFGLLQMKPDDVLTSISWNIGFYFHIVLGGIALLIGWIQFNEGIRLRRLKWHRALGKVYVFAALFSSLASIYISLYATGGIVATLGFMLLGLFWFYSTYKAYNSIRNKNVNTHQKMMIYSYAACLAAVTLRIYLPLLTMAFGEFTPAYLIVAWLSWVPNVVVAYFLTRGIRRRDNNSLGVIATN
jgi:uncharacterized membrane protein